MRCDFLERMTVYALTLKPGRGQTPAQRIQSGIPFRAWPELLPDSARFKFATNRLGDNSAIARQALQPLSGRW